MDFSKRFFTSDYNKITDRQLRNVLVNTDHGLMIINRFDNREMVGHGQWLLDHGNCNTVEAHVCLSNVDNPNPIIFDIGANIGTFTTWFAKTFVNGQVYSFEPQPQVFNMLCGNVAINNYYNVRVFNYGLGSKNDKFYLYEPDYFSSDDFGTFSLINTKLNVSNKKIVIEVKTLDWFVEFYQIPYIDLLKIDAEGMDLDILKGGIETIKKFSPNIFIEHNDNIRSIFNDIATFLLPFGYYFEEYQNNILCRKK